MVVINKLEFDGSNEFWNKIKTSIAIHKIGVFSDGGLIFVVMSDETRMVPFMRTKEELFNTTIKSKIKKYRVIINGQFYGLSNLGINDALWGSDPVDPKHTTPEGSVISNNKLIGGRPAPMMFYIANYWKKKPRYIFNPGVAPTTASSAIGGCGPIIINGMPYGIINKFSSGTVGKVRGEPTDKNKPHLLQRSNSTFSAVLKKPPYTGKTIIAHSSKNKILFALVLPHEASGVSLDKVRDDLLLAGIDNAVFLDGSDSSLLVVDGDFIASPASNKNETNTVGIGFDIGG